MEKGEAMTDKPQPQVAEAWAVANPDGHIFASTARDNERHVQQMCAEGNRRLDIPGQFYTVEPVVIVPREEWERLQRYAMERDELKKSLEEQNEEYCAMVIERVKRDRLSE